MGEPPAAVIPINVESFFSDLCAADLENNLYIRVYDAVNFDSIVLYHLRKNGNIERKLMPNDQIKPGVFVTINCAITPYQDAEFHRATVLSIDNGIINCFKIDDGINCSVLAQNVFQPLQKEIEAPSFAMKCRMEGMELFDGLPHLRMAYRMIKMHELDDPFYDTTVLEVKDGVPVVRMVIDGFELKNKVQRYIHGMCEQRVLKTWTPIQAEIMHAEETGCIWFHTYSDNGLLTQIQDMLANSNLDVQDYSKFKRIIKSDIEHWKLPYFTPPTAIYITKSSNDGVYYRAKVTRDISKDKAEVEFIDYGNKEIVDRKSLILAVNVDENLAYVPPQCIKAKLHDINHLNVDEFWKNVSEDVHILIIEEQGMDGKLPEIEIYQIESSKCVNDALKDSLTDEEESSPLTVEANNFDLDALHNEIIIQPNNMQTNYDTEDLIKKITDKLKTLEIDEENGFVQRYEKIESKASQINRNYGIDAIRDPVKKSKGKSIDHAHMISEIDGKLSEMISEFCRDVKSELTKVCDLKELKDRMQQLEFGILRIQQCGKMQTYDESESGVSSDNVTEENSELVGEYH